MGYLGTKVSIPVGLGALQTDDPQGQIAKEKLISALNINIQNGLIEKDFGAIRLNSSPFPAGVLCAFDWWPNDYTQRTIALCRDGKVYKLKDDGTVSEITASGSAPTTLTTGVQAHMLACGAESENRNRKLFIFTGNDPIQVISGDSNVRTNISNPAADWTTNNYPFYGFIHRARLFAFGNKNSAHRSYSSSATDHEDFSAVTNFQFDVFPGDAEYLVSGWVYKSRQFLAKYPYGVFYLVDDDPDPGNWYYVKLTNAFGGASPHAFCPALDDTLLATSTGSVVSLKGSFQLSNVESENILNTLRIERFMRQNVSQSPALDRWAVYYEDKKQVMFTYRSPTSAVNDRILLIDLSHNKPEPIFITKDQPNFLGLRKDFQGVQRPFYGAEDGYIYLMDRMDRSVNGVGYRSEFQLPYIDFGDTRNKLFDFVEITYEPTGKWNLSCDVLVDGQFVQTINFPLYYDRVLAASSTSQPYNFILNQTRLSGSIPRSSRKKISRMGRSISLKFYNSTANQNFKVSVVTVYFRSAEEQQKENS